MSLQKLRENKKEGEKEGQRIGWKGHYTPKSVNMKDTRSIHLIRKNIEKNKYM